MPDISNLVDTNAIIFASVYWRIVKPLYKGKYGLIPAVIGDFSQPILLCSFVQHEAQT